MHTDIKFHLYLTAGSCFPLLCASDVCDFTNCSRPLCLYCRASYPWSGEHTVMVSISILQSKNLRLTKIKVKIWSESRSWLGKELERTLCCVHSASSKECWSVCLSLVFYGKQAPTPQHFAWGVRI